MHVAPIHKLPPELMSLIFLHATDAPVVIGDCPFTSNRPLLPASVCRRWRAICLSTPSLWTSLRVFLRDVDATAQHQLTDIFELWLVRAGRMPLDLVVERSERCQGLGPLLELLYRHETTLRSLELTLDDALADPKLHDQLSKVEHVVLRPRRGLDGFDSSVRVTAWRDAPRLRRAEISYIDVENIDLPWRQLTHLTIHHNIDATFAFLHQSPELEYFCMRDAVSRPGTYPSRLKLQRLHTLRISTTIHGYFLDGLDLPALRVLELEIFSSADAMARLVALATHSRWKLRRYSCRDVCASADILAYTLVDLTRNPLPLFLPNLRALTALRWDPHNGEALQRTLKFVSSRFEGVPGAVRLKEFRTSFTPNSDPALKAAVREFLGSLADAGLEYIERSIGLAEILELGCGAGVPATQVLVSHEKEFAVTGNDISAAQIALAKEHVPKAKAFIQGDMLGLDFPAASLDAVLAFYSIFHLAAEEQGKMIEKIYGWLKPGGWFLCNFGVEEGDIKREGWFKPEVTMYSSGLGVEGTREVFKQEKLAGFKVVVDSVAVETVGRFEERFHWIMAQKEA
ncbi:hypothetical protein HMN09_00866900 [Mycena chlorophos]|uniref:Methyltransferase domain-containing protein n=1 Tax=Mycena chlorophos TaxID=658473 RepID=A0A8H6SNM6_MYCCL|nr:hypothetical protein HMN09_00866900 [Mycena chlorophos]